MAAYEHIPDYVDNVTIWPAAAGVPKDSPRSLSLVCLRAPPSEHSSNIYSFYSAIRVNAPGPAHEPGGTPFNSNSSGTKSSFHDLAAAGRAVGRARRNYKVG